MSISKKVGRHGSGEPGTVGVGRLPRYLVDGDRCVCSVCPYRFGLPEMVICPVRA